MTILLGLCYEIFENIIVKLFAQKKLPKWLRNICITKKCVFNNFEKYRTLLLQRLWRRYIYIYIYIYIYYWLSENSVKYCICFMQFLQYQHYLTSLQSSIAKFSLIITFYYSKWCHIHRFIWAYRYLQNKWS